MVSEWGASGQWWTKKESEWWVFGLVVKTPISHLECLGLILALTLDSSFLLMQSLEGSSCDSVNLAPAVYVRDLD